MNKNNNNLIRFKTINDVENWLDPMDYDGFWHALAHLGLDISEKSHCDEQIKSGANKDTVLNVMKAFTRIEFTQSLKLKRKPLTPWVKLVVDNG